MFSLVYRSRATANFGNNKIAEMLNKARVFNSKNGITGCLLYYNGQFIQYIEGNHLKVLSLFDKIKTDKRHNNVEILSHGKINSREFKDWSMAYENFMGDNDELQYVKLLTGDYFEGSNTSEQSQAPSVYFWKTVKQLIYNSPSEQLTK
ncbi:MAG: BLUF domain-containing protein [Croceitalea sp.]|nr:BLUF domain-containing protein [Croceitalea sp.]